jgi:hypothetical protein
LSNFRQKLEVIRGADFSEEKTLISVTLRLIPIKLVHITLVYIPFVSKSEASGYEDDLIQMNTRSFVK